MRAATLAVLILIMPAAASAQAHQTTRTIVDSAGRRVTCSVGRLGAQQTRGVAIVSPYGSTVDAAPSDAIWRQSGCAEEMSMTQSERDQRALAMIAAGPNPQPKDSAEDILASIAAIAGRQPPARDGGTVSAYTTNGGDTASGIARRFGVTVDALERSNHRVFRGSLDAGQRITMPEGAMDKGSDPYATGQPVL